MKELQEQLINIENKEQTMRKEFDAYQRKLQIYKQIKKEYDLKLHQQSLLDDQLSKSSYTRVSLKKKKKLLSIYIYIYII